jgi:adenosylcobyric acid synthase
MPGRVLMVQGTASSVGKSVLVTALCRIFSDMGYDVAPFKAQNMSNNSYVTPDGLEIGRAQAEQARAARKEPAVDMNPVLLKPEADRRSQVVLLGRPRGSLDAADFNHKRDLWRHVRGALDRLRARHDLVIIEGAGSPAEVNLRRGDIVNMRVARYARAPVLLVGDIDNGGVFAHLVGTLALLTRSERALVKGFVINKFRGDYSLLDPGLRLLEARTGRPVLGVLPYIHDLRLAEEDAVALDRPQRARTQRGCRVRVVRLPHISNFDDFDPLAEGADLRYVTAESQLEDADVVVLPGTKATLADLRWLKGTGLAAAVCRCHAEGRAVIGVCGGYQMLGEWVEDPQGVEGQPGGEAGLGLLPARTVLASDKTTLRRRGRVATATGLLAGAAGVQFQGYEVHMGRTTCAAPPAFVLQDGGPDGAISGDGRVLGTYLHGLFANDALRAQLLRNLGWQGGGGSSWDPDEHIDALAGRVRGHLDLDAIRGIAGL